MIGFALCPDGDVKIKDGQIQMVDGNELLRQTCQTVLGTNKGEWKLNPSEGIDFHTLLGKQVNYAAIQQELLDGLKEIDDTFVLDSFQHSISPDRKLHISFQATCSKGMITGENNY